jgi:hypothetical protein
VALQLFSKVQQHVTLAFLQAYPTPQAAMAASVEQLTQTLKQARHPQAKIAATKTFEQLHQPHLMADAITTRTRVSADAGSGQAVAASGGRDCQLR